MARKVNYDFLNCMKDMPALYHTNKDGSFDICKSEVVQWIMKQPEVGQKVFDMAKNKGLIEYDPDSKTWRGVDYNGD